MTSNISGVEDEIGGMDSTSSGSACESCLLDDDQGEDEHIAILCEVVGARDLTVQDFPASGEFDVDTLRPFCIIKFGDRIVHRTKAAEDLGPNPIWTVATKSLFLIKATPREMSENLLSIGLYTKRDNFLSARLNLDLNRIFLGQVNLDSSKVLSHMDEERFEVSIEDELGEQSSDLGHLALRFRLATESDQQIVKLFNRYAKMSAENSEKALKELMMGSKFSNASKLRPQAKIVTEIDESKIAQSTFVGAISSVFSSRSVRDKETGGHKVRVKPHPDPDRVEETTFMSPREICMETRNASHNWIEAGSGKLGKLYCEVLSCHDLPNVDFGGAVGNVTDTCVCLVYEDTCAMTDVIDDELSPHWLPWTQRAFCFGMMHPASILYLGVFDYDLGTDHEPLGRVAINVSNLQRNTVHTLKYNLYSSSNVTDRTAIGSVMIRVRIECPDEKAALLAALKPRPRIFVNVKKPKSFKVVRYTCFGEYDGEEKFDMTVTRSYINEIFEHKAAFTYAVSDAVTSLIFWRGQVEILSIMVPLHSLLFFCMAADLVERPHMVISYSLLCVAWIMLATLTVRRQHPSPWNSAPSFWHYVHILWTGKSPTPIASIKAYEGHKEAESYEDAWRARLERDRIVAEERLKLQQELDEIGDDNISTKVPNGIPIDLLARLTRYQGMAGRYTKYMRFVKIILTWEESVVSFWITAGFLVAGLVTMFLPMRFLLIWTGRVVVWAGLGPHMKLVDLYLRANRRKDRRLKELVEHFDVQSKVARLRREDALKQKDIKCIAFGQYSTQVPSFNLARHFDRPLPESSARLCRSTPESGNPRRISVVTLHKSPWIPGQQLFGAMIPRPEESALPHQNELESQMHKLDRFKHLVESAIVSNGAEARRERLELNKLGLDPHVPLAEGYEVIPEFDEPIDEFERNAEKKKMAIVLTNSNIINNDFNEDNEMIFETDGMSIHEVKTHDSSDDEGLEVVGIGRFGSFSQNLGESFPQGVADEPNQLVSLMYSPSESKVDCVIYQHPEDAEIDSTQVNEVVWSEDGITEAASN